MATIYLLSSRCAFKDSIFGKIIKIEEKRKERLLLDDSKKCNSRVRRHAYTVNLLLHNKNIGIRHVSIVL